MPLTNHTILITGAGGGLGGTAALALAQQGARIILLDKSIPKLEKAYDAIINANAPTPAIYPFDLAGATEVQYHELADTIEEKYGHLDGLLHSATELDAFTPMSIHSTMAWGHTLNVNLNAPFLLTQVLLPVLQKSEHASIVFTSDSFVRKARAYTGAYGVSKIALESYAKILAEELSDAGKIRVNILVPGPVDSPLRKKSFPAEDKSRLPKMEEISPAYLYLFGAKSIGTTGQIVDARTFKL
ncbi:MAG: SDR family NAD(P)-dependent oxidoreductase [Methyloprofundus sp.]|nr:SDR family NAD(P)-dependent oxidoreductase [Methyloprofundus sp.]